VLQGAHQIENAGLAVVMATMLDDALAPSEDAIRAGLERAVWPARLQRLTRGPLAKSLPKGWTLLLDGGHNPAAAEALALSLKEGDPRPLHLIVGMLTTKDEAAFLAPLAPLASSIQAVPVPDEAASRDPETAAAEAREAGIDMVPARDVEAALLRIVETSPEPGRVLICGSLYLAGHVLRTNS
jgi:dihydrofolate synthase/folylpolyglutamate synthase